MWTLNHGFSDNVYVHKTFIQLLDSPKLKKPLNTSTISDITNIYVLKNITILRGKIQPMRVMPFV